MIQRDVFLEEVHSGQRSLIDRLRFAQEKLTDSYDEETIIQAIEAIQQANTIINRFEEICDYNQTGQVAGWRLWLEMFG